MSFNETESEARPDYIRCITHPFAQTTGQKTWCKKHQTDPWKFLNIDHAASNGIAEGRLVACPECVAEIYKFLQYGTK